MTIGEAYAIGRKTLAAAGVESPSADALLLLEKAFGVSGRAGLAVRSGEQADPGKAALFEELIVRRTREPLQYIAERWEIDGMALHVGPGVLIPREDTLTLVETACGLLRQMSPAPRILDLCAGTGLVGLSIARRIPGAEVVCVEKSPAAMGYLARNIAAYGEGRVTAVEGDVLEKPLIAGPFDGIVSNPPYIRTSDLESLAWEVQCEPRMALDGGRDGLLFYKAICAEWKSLVREGGFIAFEVGYDIPEGVAEVMRRSGMRQICVTKDINGVERCIFGTHSQK